MKLIRHSLLLVTIIVQFGAQPASAGSFGESFKNWLLGSEAEASTLKQARPLLDDIAEGCMQCHNGVQATHIVVKNADAGLQFSGSGQQVNHPVGMNYDDYAARRSRDYIPRFGLDSNILLMNGQVSCVSCHRLKEADETEVFIDTPLDEARRDTFEAHSNEMQMGRASKENCTASGNLTVGPRETDLCLACHAI